MVIDDEDSYHGMAAGMVPDSSGDGNGIQAVTVVPFPGALEIFTRPPRMAARSAYPADPYAPSRTSRQTVLLVSGLHSAGIDEPRLMALARELAKTNVTVVTPEIPELRQFNITPALTDRIEEAAVWLATESGMAPTGRIG